MGKQESAVDQTAHSGQTITGAAPVAGAQISAASKRQEKRWKWWSQEQEKRLALPATNSSEITSDPQKAPKKVGNPKYPPREPVAAASVHKRGSGKGKDAEAKKKAENNFTIFVGQIPFDAKEAEVKKLFESAGEITPGGFRWRINSETKKFKGFAFVDYANKKSFERSFSLHHAIINDRPINVEATITGGRKSKIRAEHVKDRTTKLREKSAAVLAAKQAKLESESKGTADKPVDPASEPTSMPGEINQEPTTTTASKTEGSARPNPRKRRNALKNKFHPYEVAARPDAPSAELPDRQEPVTPVKPEESNASWLDSKKKVVVQCKPVEAVLPPVKIPLPAKPIVVSGVRPKEQHLASLAKPRVHIKFPE